MLQNKIIQQSIMNNNLLIAILVTICICCAFSAFAEEINTIKLHKHKIKCYKYKQLSFNYKYILLNFQQIIYIWFWIYNYFLATHNKSNVVKLLMEIKNVEDSKPTSKFVNFN